ncbi:AAA family ATPase [bacterium Unc6]|nr:AAA family ATPase [bacterium Unc6]
MKNLFNKNNKDQIPLAYRMRPRNLQEWIGQEHILGKGKLLRRAIEADRIMSLILYGPAGCGKTALAYLIAEITKAHFEDINAVESNISQIREIILLAKKRKQYEGKKTILFIDELHRFNKAQQDVLMPDVENGNLILIGATIHNPFFSIISPLISRSMIFQLNPLSEDEIGKIINNALKDKERGLGNISVILSDDAEEFLCKVCDGDARRALNALEIGVLTTQADKDDKIHFTLAVAEESIQKRAIRYDTDEDEHYDTASAFIKSMRGSDPDAAIYWMAKMLEAGEDPRFIARRIVICASEDVGNADPMAIVVANAALGISEFVGLPECRIPLAQAVIYVACAPKSNACYCAIEKAIKDVQKSRIMQVPDALKSASYSGAEKLGRGKNYKYAHNYKNHYVQQEYIPEEKKYYIPTEIGYEKKIKEYLEKIKKA